MSDYVPSGNPSWMQQIRPQRDPDGIAGQLQGLRSTEILHAELMGLRHQEVCLRQMLMDRDAEIGRLKGIEQEYLGYQRERARIVAERAAPAHPPASKPNPWPENSRALNGRGQRIGFLAEPW